MPSHVSLEYLNDMNLYEAECYHFDMSQNGSVANIEIENVIYRLMTNGTTLALYLAPGPNVAMSGVKIDMKRMAQYDTLAVESTIYDDYSLNIASAFDSAVYGSSREFHVVRLRQQNPETGNWDACDISLFVSGGLSRVDVHIKWTGKNIEYVRP